MPHNPPPGPPPTYEEASQYASSTSAQPPPYHNWQEAVPDTSIFPPPPVSGYYSSGTGNASESDADRAHLFCDNTPLWIPALPSSTIWSEVNNNHDIRPVQPSEFHGKLSTPSRGHWKGSSADRNGDCILLTHLPLYFAAVDSPFAQGKRKTVYFELKLNRLRAGPGDGSGESGFAIGFVAQPYPSWRSPGWERGSLGVCSDDGCRFVNDSWGGRDFTTPVRIGETVGLGLIIDIPSEKDHDTMPAGRGHDDKKSMSHQQSPSKRCKVEVFFTRNGRPAGGWNLHEEMDEESGGVHGLEGDFDLYGAIGLFGGVDFESCFDPAGWLWKPT